MNDLVSIIMPSYNTSQYIGKSIQSVLIQTYTNWELIIVDDCSTDNTDEVVGGFNDARIRYYKNTRNSGTAVSRNKALREARGKWIAFLDSDDLWNVNKLEKQIRFMESNKYRFSYTNYEEIDEHDKKLGISITGPKNITKTDMLNYCWLGCLTVMYDVRIVGLIQVADIRKNNDYTMWLKISKKADCYLLDEKLALYRKRRGSVSRHSYVSLIKWHYKMFRYAENVNIGYSILYTIRNLLYGVYKKYKYVDRDN